MGFDDGGFAAQTTFYHIGVDRALYQKIHGADFLGFFFKHTDKLFADDLAFGLGIGYTGQFGEEPVPVH